MISKEGHSEYFAPRPKLELKAVRNLNSSIELVVDAMKSIIVRPVNKHIGLDSRPFYSITVPTNISSNWNGNPVGRPDLEC